MDDKKIDFKQLYYTKSYKMVWPESDLPDGLSVAFKIKKLAEYTPGRQFVANPRNNYLGRFGVQANEPIFHYCDNAVDILMWYWNVFNFIDYDSPMIGFLEIKPIGTIYKNRTPDETELWQCGVNKIEIVKHTNIKQVAQDACQEIAQNQDEIISRYKNYEMARFIAKIKYIAQK